MNEVEILPPEVSGNAKRNAYYMHCQIVEQQRPYAVCLHLCSERKDGRLEAIYADCSAAIGKKRCPALHMRQQEKEAGKAIYFKERNKFEGLAKSAASFLSATAKEALSKLTPSRKSSVIDRIDGGDYASAINAQLKKAEQPSASITTEARAGESLLEMAKRLMAQNKS